MAVSGLIDQAACARMIAARLETIDGGESGGAAGRLTVRHLREPDPEGTRRWCRLMPLRIERRTRNRYDGEPDIADFEGEVRVIMADDMNEGAAGGGAAGIGSYDAESITQLVIECLDEQTLTDDRPDGEGSGHTIDIQRASSRGLIGEDDEHGISVIGVAFAGSIIRTAGSRGGEDHTE